MLKRCLTLLLALALCLGAVPAVAEVQQSPLLDAAFSLIEKNNPFLDRYNAITGAEVEARFELGMPYFFGGKFDTTTAKDGTPLMFSREPEYTKRKMWENTKFYRKDQSYIYGFDCSGFTKWILAQIGEPEHDDLDAMINQWGKYGKKYHIYSHRKGKEMPPYNELAATLQVGDLLVAKKGARHIMMFIGTLRDYGYTEEEVPELAEYLDHALVIHSGPNFDYTDRIQAFLDATDDPYYADVNPPDGGVSVSIIGVPFKQAPNQGHFGTHDFAWYELPDGYKLTIWDLPSATSFCWWRVGGLEEGT